MKIWQKLLGKKEDMTTESKKNSKKQRFKKKYQSFQELLSSNNTVLEVMADMEEKLSGEFLFDRHYIDQNIIATANGVKNIIDNLNKISHDKYSALYERFNDINSNIENLLTRKNYSA
jgi:pyruvate,water dikinase